MKNTHGGNIYKVAAAHNVAPQDITDFSANINPLGMSPKGQAALTAHLNEIIHYPDPEYTEFSPDSKSRLWMYLMRTFWWGMERPNYCMPS